MPETTPATPPHVVIHLCAKNDRNGNPRRCYVVIRTDQTVLGVYREGYLGIHSVPPEYRDAASMALRIESTPSQIREIANW